ncbi:hypothetical protein KBC54_04200 [Patescibacteria group bacterium]|nr:hypothetical protein [Patescibacteria group bacterium]
MQFILDKEEATMAKGKSSALVITKDSACPYCKGTRGHSANQRPQCKKGQLGASSSGGVKSSKK